MANPINETVTNEALLQLGKLYELLRNSSEAALTASGNLATLDANLKKLKNPSDFMGHSKDTATASADLLKQIEINKSLAAEIEKLQKAKKKFQETTLQEKVDARIILQGLTAEAKALSTVTDAYQKLDAEHKQALSSAKSIGAQYGVTDDRFKKAAASANELKERLSAVDTDLGLHGRNVGNYTSHWNGLGNSINQLTREAPAFAVSMQTGFLAISNNIPTLVDEINKLKATNIDLKNSGEPVKSVFKELAGSLFSWQTAISLAITLSVVYGQKIMNWVMGLGDAKEALDQLTKSQERHSQSVKNVIENLDHLMKIELDKAKLEGKTLDEQNKIQESFLKRKSDLAQKDAEIAEKQFLEAQKFRGKDSKELESKIKADAKLKLDQFNRETLEGRKKGTSTLTLDQEIKTQRRIVEEAENKIKKIKTNASDEVFAKITENTRKQNENAKRAAFELSEFVSGAKVSEMEALEAESKKRTKVDKTIEDNQKNKYQRQLSDLERQKEIANNSLDLYKDTESEKINVALQTALIEKKIIEVKYKEEIRLANGNLDLIKIAENNKKTALENNAQAGLAIMHDYTDAVIKDLEAQVSKSASDGDVTDPLLMQKIVGTLADQKKVEDYLKKTTKDLKDFLAGFEQEFMGKSGFSQTFKLLFEVDEAGNNFFDQIEKSALNSREKYAAYFNGIAEIGQETFNFLSNISNAHFAQEREILQSQYDFALKGAGDNKDAQEKLAEDFEAHKIDIANRENQAKKQQALFNIAIDTAQAVVSALAHYDYGSAILFGILGIAQAVAVSSQEIPQYFEGGTHAGGLAMINDGKGSDYQETFKTPDGKLHQAQGRNVILDLPAGTEIFTQKQMLQMAQEEPTIGNAPIMVINNAASAKEIDSIFAKHFGNITTQNVHIDSDGYNKFLQKGSAKTKILGSSFSGRGFTIN